MNKNEAHDIAFGSSVSSFEYGRDLRRQFMQPKTVYSGANESIQSPVSENIITTGTVDSASANNTQDIFVAGKITK